MNAVRILRTLIVCELLMFIITLVVDSMTLHQLPKAIQEYNQQLDSAPLTTVQSFFAVVAILMLISIVISWVGLWRLWRPARSIYTITLIIGILSSPFFDQTIMSPVAGSLDEIASICTGLILGLLFFSDARHHFDKKKEV